MTSGVFRDRVSLANVILALVLFAHAESSIAKSDEKAVRSAAVETAPKPVCVFSEAAYQKAWRLVRGTGEFKTVQRQAKQARPAGRVVYMPAIDQPVLWKGRCHQSLTVYVDRLDHLERRFSFLADPRTGKLFLQDSNGEYQALGKSGSGRIKPATQPTDS